MKIAIIGGGALGLVAGLRRAERGDAVTVYEAGAQIGGLASAFDTATGAPPVYLDKFYHHVFGTDTDILRLTQEMGLDGDMVWGAPPTCTLWNGAVHRMDGTLAAGNPFAGTHIDTALALLSFAPLPLPDRVRFAVMGAKLKFAPSHIPFSGQTAAQWARREAGSVAFERVLLPLLRGKFGDAYADIALSWLWSRFHERTQRLGYLRGSFHRLYERIAAKLTEHGGTLRLNAPVERLHTGASGVTVTTKDGTVETFDRVLVTAPTDAFCRMAAGELPVGYAEKYANAVRYRAAHCLVLSLKEAFCTFYWLNVNDPGYPFLALVEHTNFLPASDYGGQHLLYVGNYPPQNDPLLAESPGDTLKRFAPFLKRIAPGFSEAQVQKAWAFGAANAQPLVTVDYESQLPPHDTPLPGVFLANMAHVYPQDRGQNYSVRLGEKMAQLL